eukprot:1147105-Pelagomonas_calceolata.AAC.2
MLLERRWARFGAFMSNAVSSGTRHSATVTVLMLMRVKHALLLLSRQRLRAAPVGVQDVNLRWSSSSRLSLLAFASGRVESLNQFAYACMRMFAWQKMLKYRQAAATAQKQASYTFYQNQRGLGSRKLLSLSIPGTCKLMQSGIQLQEST